MKTENGTIIFETIMNNEFNTTGYFPVIVTERAKHQTIGKIGKICDLKLGEIVNIKTFLGETFVEIIVEDEAIMFINEYGQKYLMHHEQSCCEGVSVEDICGDINDLIGSKILMAQESVSVESFNKELEYDSYTWTFYKLATIKGYVDIRWFGSSNGHYSEDVQINKVL